MIKYIRGDTVRIRTKEEIEHCPAVSPTMWTYAGMIAKIWRADVLIGKSKYYEVDVDNGRYWWHETCFEEVNKREDMEYML